MKWISIYLIWTIIWSVNILHGQDNTNVTICGESIDIQDFLSTIDKTEHKLISYLSRVGQFDNKTLYRKSRTHSMFLDSATLSSRIYVNPLLDYSQIEIDSLFRQQLNILPNEKWTIVLFKFRGCTACKKNDKLVQQLRTKYNTFFNIKYVSFDPITLENESQYVQLDKNYILDKFQIQSWPTTMLLSPEGELSFIDRFFPSEDCPFLIDLIRSK